MAMMSQREFNADKGKNFSEWYNTVIYAADLVDDRYNVQGFFVHRPWVTRMIRSIYKLFEGELEEDGHEPVVFPTVIPKENFEKESEHVEGFVPQVFWVTEAGGEKLSRPLALRPTSETAFYQMYALWVQSVSDLPMKLYQSCSVYRYEHETLPFLRGREFLWIETHDLFESGEQAIAQVKRDNAIARKVLFEELGIPVSIFERPQWDTFPGAHNTFAYDVLLPDGKVLQVGSTHYLGQNFSKAFGVKTSSEGKENFVHSTCFGPGIWRMVAAIVGVHGDNKGLVLPQKVAPIEVVIVPIFKGEISEPVARYSEKIVEELEKAGLKTKVDDGNKTPGFKYNYWELRGVPLRVEVGGREVENNSATIARRDTKEKETVPLEKLGERAKLLLNEMLAALRDKAVRELRERTVVAENLSGVEKQMKAGGFAITPFCSIGMDGKNCAQTLQEKTEGGKVRGVPAFAREMPSENQKCVVCGKKAAEIVYVAKQH